ncbi:MAG: hypothetical protein WCK81_13220, partial [Betaproteobacteria bacterium]
YCRGLNSPALYQLSYRGISLVSVAKQHCVFVVCPTSFAAFKPASIANFRPHFGALGLGDAARLFACCRRLIDAGLIYVKGVDYRRPKLRKP